MILYGCVDKSSALHKLELSLLFMAHQLINRSFFRLMISNRNGAIKICVGRTVGRNGMRL